MIDIQVPESPPNIELQPRLQVRLSRFSFDAERYVAGLTLAGVPTPAIETLNTEFKKGMDPGSSVYYLPDRHTVKVEVARHPLKYGETKWHGTKRTASSEINYSLAKTAMYISEHVLKHPDRVAYERAHPTIRDNLRILGGSSLMLLGSVAGAGVAEATHTVHPWAGSLVAALGAGLLDIGVLVAIESSPGRRSINKAARQALDRSHKRASEFANSREAKDIFNGLVELEFQE